MSTSLRPRRGRHLPALLLLTLAIGATAQTPAKATPRAGRASRASGRARLLRSALATGIGQAVMDRESGVTLRFAAARLIGRTAWLVARSRRPEPIGAGGWNLRNRRGETIGQLDLRFPDDAAEGQTSRLTLTQFRDRRTSRQRTFEIDPGPRGTVRRLRDSTGTAEVAGHGTMFPARTTAVEKTIETPFAQR